MQPVGDLAYLVSAKGAQAVQDEDDLLVQRGGPEAARERHSHMMPHASVHLGRKPPQDSSVVTGEVVVVASPLRRRLEALSQFIFLALTYSIGVLQLTKRHLRRTRATRSGMMRSVLGAKLHIQNACFVLGLGPTALGVDSPGSAGQRRLPLGRSGSTYGGP